MIDRERERTGRAARHALVCALLMLFATTAALAQAKWRTLPSGYRVLESGYTLVQQTGDRMYWIDDDRVIFVGYTPQQAALFRKARLTPAVFIWNVRTGVTTEHAKASGPASRLCYHAGFLRVIIEWGPEGSYRLEMSGLLGQERVERLGKEVPAWNSYPRDPSSPGSLSNPYTCRLEKTTEEPFAQGKRRVVFPLLPQHGALWVEGGEPAGEFVRFYRAADKQWVDLPIKRDKTMMDRVPYVRWADLYMIAERIDSSEFRSLQPNVLGGWWPVHLLRSDGSVKTVSLPITTVVSVGIGRLVFARSGVFTSGGSPTPRSTGTAGLYRLDGRGWKRVLVGQSHAADLSPNGCLYAQGLNSGPGSAADLSRVTVIDLCSGAKS